MNYVNKIIKPGSGTIDPRDHALAPSKEKCANATSQLTNLPATTELPRHHQLAAKQ